MTWDKAQRFFNGAIVGAGAALIIAFAIGQVTAWMFFWFGTWTGLAIGTKIVRYWRSR